MVKGRARRQGEERMKGHVKNINLGAGLGILLLLFIAVAGPVLLLFHREYLQNTLMRSLFDYVTVLFLIIIGIIIYSFLNLDKFRNLLEKTIRFFRHHINHHPKLINARFRHL